MGEPTTKLYGSWVTLAKVWDNSSLCIHQISFKLTFCDYSTDSVNLYIVQKISWPSVPEIWHHLYWFTCSQALPTLVLLVLRLIRKVHKICVIARVIPCGLTIHRMYGRLTNRLEIRSTCASAHKVNSQRMVSTATSWSRNGINVLTVGLQ